MTDLERAKNAIVDYLMDEFGDDEEFCRRNIEENPVEIGVCYTTTEDDYHEIQWNIDLIGMRFYLEVDWKPMLEHKCKDMAELADMCEALSFYDLFNEANWAINEWKENKKKTYTVFFRDSDRKEVFEKEEDALAYYREHGASSRCYIAEKVEEV